MPRRSPPPGRWYPPPSRPRPADGIRTKSRAGAIGATWWSQRFIAVLESFNMGARLTRGRRYARAGQVLELTVEAGRVHTRVQGSRATPYQVSIQMLCLSDKDWARMEEALTSRAVFLAKLLAGEMPADIEEAFTACRLHLFPTSPGDLTSDCTCPDWANPCKHIAATYYLLAEAFDDDPFLILAWRGRTRAELLARLEAQRDGALASPGGPARWTPPGTAAPPLEECLDRYFDAGHLPPATSRPGAVLPHALLLGLDDPPLEIRGRGLADVLRPAYAAMVEAAQSRILGEPHAP
ncbi:MAG: SWIM zinc finger family protein [Acidimicrobiia bacterium]